MVKWQGSARRLHARIAWKLMTGAAIIALSAGCTRLGKKDTPAKRLVAANYSKQARPALKSNHPLYVATAHWAKKHQKNPADPKAALNYASNLKALGSKEKALDVLALTYQLNQGNGALASDYGRLALDLGQSRIAEPLLNQAMRSKGQADWRVLSALGTVNAKRGDHKKAQSYYMAALRKNPKSASVFNNLALSYALDGKAGDAEKVLKKAVSKGHDTVRIRQNLAMVLGLQNKNSEAQMMAQADPAARKARQDINAVRTRVKPIKIAKAPKKARKPKEKADTITTASLPARKPVARKQPGAATKMQKPKKATIAKVLKSKKAKSARTAKPVKVSSAIKTGKPEKIIRAANKAPAADLPWRRKPAKSARAEKIRTASLAVNRRKTTSRTSPKTELRWNITVKKSSTGTATPVTIQKSQIKVLKQDRDFSITSGN